MCQEHTANWSPFLLSARRPIGLLFSSLQGPPSTPQAAGVSLLHHKAEHITSIWSPDWQPHEVQSKPLNPALQALCDLAPPDALLTPLHRHCSPCPNYKAFCHSLNMVGLPTSPDLCSCCCLLPTAFPWELPFKPPLPMQSISTKRPFWEAEAERGCLPAPGHSGIKWWDKHWRSHPEKAAALSKWLHEKRCVCESVSWPVSGTLERQQGKRWQCPTSFATPERISASGPGPGSCTESAQPGVAHY